MTGTLEVDDLHKRYGDVVALDGVHLRVEPGRLLGFLGPNGSGKTTTMRAVLRLVELDAGTVAWGGRPIGDEARRAIGYLPQERGLYARMRVHEQVAYFGRLAGLERPVADASATKWLDMVGLGDRREDLVQALSVGNQQRVQLAVALVHSPKLLILDEPFAGLDPVAVDNLQRIIVEQVDAGVAVVFSSHQLELVQDVCEDVSIIAGGRTVAEGTVQDLRAASAERIVDIGFEDRTIEWMPERGDIRAIRCTPGRTVFAVPASAPPGAIMEAAGAVGALTAISYAPPSLDEVFLELVDSSRSGAGEMHP